MCQRPVGLIDIFPTLTDLCGLPDPYEWQNLADDPAFDDVKTHMASLMPQESVPTVEPRNIGGLADLDKEDMEQFVTEIWPKWLKEAVPPLL